MSNLRRPPSSIDIVIPVYNEQSNIPELLSRLETSLGGQNYRVLFVDDGSSDSSLQVMRDAGAKNSKVQFISLSRNFGHQSALRAGLDRSTAEVVISMDCDLQQPPSLLPKMLERWREGFDVVYAVRNSSKSLSFKSFTSGFFYAVINSLSDTKVPNGAADFRLLDRKLVDVIKNLAESGLFLRGIVPWLGFKQYAIEYDEAERYTGETKYSLRKMIRLARDGITSFSVKPLRLSMFLGAAISSLAFLYAAYGVYIRLFTDQAVSGWTSILVSILLLGGLQLLMLGIIGEYLGRLFIQSMRRPSYIVAETSAGLTKAD